MRKATARYTDFDCPPNMLLHRYERTPPAPQEVFLEPLAAQLPMIDLVELRQWDMVRIFPRHAHPDLFHLDTFFSGSGAYWIGNRLHPVRPDTFYFIPPNTPHQLRIDDGSDLLHLSIKFRYDLIDADFLPHSYTVQDSLRSSLQTRLRECANTLFDDPRQTIPATLVFASVLASIHHECIQSKETVGEHRLVVEAKRFMDEKFTERLVLDDIATQVGVGGSHLCRVFKKETGETPFEYLRRVRLRCAKYWLHQTNEKLADIARITGFGAEQEMYRAFQRLEGLSPRGYRNAIVRESEHIAQEAPKQ